MLHQCPICLVLAGCVGCHSQHIRLWLDFGCTLAGVVWWKMWRYKVWHLSRSVPLMLCSQDPCFGIWCFPYCKTVCLGTVTKLLYRRVVGRCFHCFLSFCEGALVSGFWTHNITVYRSVHDPGLPPLLATWCVLGWGQVLQLLDACHASVWRIIRCVQLCFMKSSPSWRRSVQVFCCYLLAGTSD